jgi:hypothetical protein
LQRVLTLMFTPVLYGRRPLLDAGSYYNLLYQEGIRPELLDFIGHNYDFHPGVLVRALHEGEPIDRVNRDIYWNLSVSRDKVREIGDIYLLVFAAVALREYEQLDYNIRTAYLEEVDGFLASLQQDGYTYRGGRIYDLGGKTILPVPLNGTSGATDTPKPPVVEPSAPAANVELATDSPAHPIEHQTVTEQIPAEGRWSRSDWIGFWSIVVVIIVGFATIAATVASPEFRRFLHLDKSPPVAPEPKPPSTALQTHINQEFLPDRRPASPQPAIPSSASGGTGIRDNATVVVHRPSTQSGAHTAVVATTGNGEQEINLGAAPTRLMFTPPGLVVDKRELPKNIEVSGQTVTVVRYTNSGLVINDHKHWDVRFTVYMVEGDPAKQ